LQLITAVFYFPFSEFALLGDALIFVTAKLSAMMLNLLNVGVYIVPPSSIYSTSSSFHEVYKPIEIILACTAIQSMALFTGVVFGVTAPIGRKLKAFCVSIPVIYGLNILRNALVGAAYFEQWFGSPLHSFFIAHEVLARIGSMVALIAIAYAVFVILPEALDLIEDLFRFIFKFKTTKRNN
jgi:archaeosortase A (PGF-CTERM-specific)